MEFSRRRRHKTEEKFSVFNLCFGFGTVPMVIRRYQQTISLSTSRRLRKRNDEEAWRRSAGDDVEFDTQNSRRHVTMKASSGEAGMSYGFLWLFAACVNLYTKLSKRRTRKKFINDRSWKKCRCFDRMIIIYSSFFFVSWWCGAELDANTTCRVINGDFCLMKSYWFFFGGCLCRFRAISLTLVIW